MEDGKDESKGETKAKGKAIKRDQDSGPTIGVWVAGNYKATAYPPSGYNSKSTAEEIAEAVAAEAAGGEALEAYKARFMEAYKASSDKPDDSDNGGEEVEQVADAPARGTREAAEAELAMLPDHPAHPGGKVIDRPMTRGA